MDHKYTSADIQVVDPRTAILRRPGMYFGELPPREWPLAMLAMTLNVPCPQDGMGITERTAAVHGDGRYEVSMKVTGFAWVRGSETSDPPANLRAQSWWRHLCGRYDISAEITSESNSAESGVPIVVSTGTFRVVATPDPAICPDLERRWSNWRSRLASIYEEFGMPGEPIHVQTADEYGSSDTALRCDIRSD